MIRCKVFMIIVGWGILVFIVQFKLALADAIVQLTIF